MKTKPERQSRAKQCENKLFVCVCMYSYFSFCNSPKEIWGFFVVRIEYEGRKRFKCGNLGLEEFQRSQRIYGGF